jgi:hypothetical protein
VFVASRKLTQRWLLWIAEPEPDFVLFDRDEVAREPAADHVVAPDLGLGAGRHELDEVVDALDLERPRVGVARRRGLSVGLTRSEIPEEPEGVVLDVVDARAADAGRAHAVAEHECDPEVVPNPCADESGRQHQVVVQRDAVPVPDAGALLIRASIRMGESIVPPVFAQMS